MTQSVLPIGRHVVVSCPMILIGSDFCTSRRQSFVLRLLRKIRTMSNLPSAREAGGYRTVVDMTSLR